MTSQNCNLCNCPVIWDKTLSPPLNSKRAKEKKMGWWREDLSKEIHTKERCDKYKASEEFFERNNTEGLTTEPKIEESKLKRTELLSVPKVNELRIEDMVANKLRSEIQTNLAVLKIYEEEVILFLKKSGDGNPNPAKVGMYMKLLQENKNES